MENKYFTKFTNLVQDQYTYGGKKYALDTKKARESTDELFDIYGKGWLLGTMHKYVFRNKNLKRERDILKIACYCYIFWLKRGFFIREDGINDPALDTNVEMKTLYFDKFISIVNERTVNNAATLANAKAMELVAQGLQLMQQKEWKNITQEDLSYIFALCYSEWFNNYRDNKVADTDTYNEEKQK